MPYRDDDEAWWAEATRARQPPPAPPPLPPEQVWPVPAPAGGGGRTPKPWWFVVGGAVLVVVAALVVVLLARRSATAPAAPPSATGPDPAPTQLAGPPVAQAVVATGSSCPPASNVDAAGTRFTYGSENAVDGDPATAWRCAGDGVGQRLVLTLSGARTVTAVGLIPGFDKIDPGNGADRWVQSPRIASALWSFDDGTVREQRFDTDVGPAARRLQTMPVPATTTSRVTVTILAIDPGRATAQGGPAAFGGFSEAGVFGR